MGSARHVLWLSANRVRNLIRVRELRALVILHRGHPTYRIRPEDFEAYVRERVRDSFEDDWELAPHPLGGQQHFTHREYPGRVVPLTPSRIRTDVSTTNRVVVENTVYLTPDRPTLERVLAHRGGELILGDALEWLAALPAGSVDLVIADGPYGIAKAPWDRFRTQAAFVDWSLAWIRAAHRVLTPTGTLYVAGFMERIAPLVAPALELYDSCHPVVWSYENRRSFGDDWGRSHELFLHLRKSGSFTFNIDAIRVPYRAHTTRYPERLSGASSLYGDVPTRWAPHPLGARPRDVIAVPVLSNGMAERTTHPAQKPEALIRRLVLASSNPGDVVVDPFVGSGTTAVVAQAEGRRWAGCDRDREYLEMARRRIEQLDDDLRASLAA